MPITYLKFISRTSLQENPDTFFVFGDDVQSMGHGGQATEMRGEPNAVGIATKRLPTMGDNSFFSDSSAKDMLQMMIGVATVENLLEQDKAVVVPSDGVGTGLSELPKRAPRLYAALFTYFDEFGIRFGTERCPWEPPL